MDFARNPEEIRAEAERKWNSKMASRGGGGGGGHRGQAPSRDVVGKAKGQGQDASVLRNRARKNENKGKNIRNAADRKMAKGMFWSNRFLYFMFGKGRFEPIFFSSEEL